MAKGLSSEAYFDIKQSALAHILEGGGIVPRSDDALHDRVARVASTHFTADRAEKELTAALEHVPAAIREQVRSAAWYLVSAFSDAGFTLGCAVASQLSYDLAAPPPAVVAPAPPGVQ